MKDLATTCLITFAVKEEARFLAKPFLDNPNAKILITNIGAENTRLALDPILSGFNPIFVLTCGFAGGLNPKQQNGNVLFESNHDFFDPEVLLSAGAIPGKFTHSDRILVTADQKRSYFEKTQADAVEMESQVVHSICQSKKHSLRHNSCYFRFRGRKPSS